MVTLGKFLGEKQVFDRIGKLTETLGNKGIALKA